MRAENALTIKDKAENYHQENRIQMTEAFITQHGKVKAQEGGKDSINQLEHNKYSNLTNIIYNASMDTKRLLDGEAER